jgi:hypothetical protein
MPQRRPTTSAGVDRTERWLASGAMRSRPWAYEELLFGSQEERERIGELGVVLDALDRERAELARLHSELDRHFEIIATLEARLGELTPQEEPEVGGASDGPEPRPERVERERPAPGSSARSYSLSRCEGFRVDGPQGPIGWVEGLRFGSRIDRPDLLEVRAGRLGRRLLLVPIEVVDEVSVEDERVLVHGVKGETTDDLLADLVDRFRRALHLGQAAS